MNCSISPAGSRSSPAQRGIGLAWRACRAVLRFVAARNAPRTSSGQGPRGARRQGRRDRGRRDQGGLLPRHDGRSAQRFAGRHPGQQRRTNIRKQPQNTAPRVAHRARHQPDERSCARRRPIQMRSAAQDHQHRLDDVDLRRIVTAAMPARRIVAVHQGDRDRWAKDNIRSTPFAGWIDTDLTRRARKEIDVWHDASSRAPAGRWGSPADTPASPCSCERASTSSPEPHRSTRVLGPGVRRSRYEARPGHVPIRSRHKTPHPERRVEGSGLEHVSSILIGRRVDTRATRTDLSSVCDFS